MTIDEPIATLGETWTFNVTFPQGLDTSLPNYIPMRLTQFSASLPIRISSSGSHIGSVKITSSTSTAFSPGQACLKLAENISELTGDTDPTYERLYFNIGITINDDLHFAPPVVYTDPDDLPMTNPPDGKFPWPVWVGVLPGQPGMPGQVVLWNDGKNSGASEKEIKILDPTFQTPTPGAYSISFALPYTGVPHLDPIPAAGIANAKILVAVPYPTATKNLLVRACDPTQTDISKCSSPMGSSPTTADTIPPSIGMFFRSLGSKTLLVYASQSNPTIKTNLFDATTTNLSDMHPISSLPATPGTWSQIFFGAGSVSSKGAQELLAVYKGTTATEVSLYALGQDGSLSPMSTDLPAKLKAQLALPVQAVAMGDLDGDGLLDLAVAQQKSGGGSTINLYMNQRDGTFSLKQGLLEEITSTTGVTALAIGDVGGDGQADVMASVAADKKVYVYLRSAAQTTNDPCPLDAPPDKRPPLRIPRQLSDN